MYDSELGYRFNLWEGFILTPGHINALGELAYNLFGTSLRLMYDGSGIFGSKSGTELKAEYSATLSDEVSHVFSINPGIARLKQLDTPDKILYLDQKINISIEKTILVNGVYLLVLSWREGTNQPSIYDPWGNMEDTIITSLITDNCEVVNTINEISGDVSFHFIPISEEIINIENYLNDSLLPIAIINKINNTTVNVYDARIFVYPKILWSSTEKEVISFLNYNNVEIQAEAKRINIDTTKDVDNNIVPSVDKFSHLLNFLSCKGNGARTVYNPFGLSFGDLTGSFPGYSVAVGSTLLSFNPSVTTSLKLERGSIGGVQKDIVLATPVEDEDWLIVNGVSFSGEAFNSSTIYINESLPIERDENKNLIININNNFSSTSPYPKVDEHIYGFLPVLYYSQEDENLHIKWISVDLSHFSIKLEENLTPFADFNYLGSLPPGEESYDLDPFGSSSKLELNFEYLNFVFYNAFKFLEENPQYFPLGFFTAKYIEESALFTLGIAYCEGNELNFNGGSFSYVDLRRHYFVNLDKVRYSPINLLSTLYNNNTHFITETINSAYGKIDSEEATLLHTDNLLGFLKKHVGGEDRNIIFDLLYAHFAKRIKYTGIELDNEYYTRYYPSVNSPNLTNVEETLQSIIKLLNTHALREEALREEADFPSPSGGNFLHDNYAHYSQRIKLNEPIHSLTREGDVLNVYAAIDDLYTFVKTITSSEIYVYIVKNRNLDNKEEVCSNIVNNKDELVYKVTFKQSTLSPDSTDSIVEDTALTEIDLQNCTHPNPVLIIDFDQVIIRKLSLRIKVGYGVSPVVIIKNAKFVYGNSLDKPLEIVLYQISNQRTDPSNFVSSKGTLIIDGETDLIIEGIISSSTSLNPAIEARNFSNVIITAKQKNYAQSRLGIKLVNPHHLSVINSCFHTLHIYYRGSLSGDFQGYFVEDYRFSPLQSINIVGSELVNFTVYTTGVKSTIPNSYKPSNLLSNDPWVYDSDEYWPVLEDYRDENGGYKIGDEFIFTKDGSTYIGYVDEGSPSALKFIAPVLDLKIINSSIYVVKTFTRRDLVIRNSTITPLSDAYTLEGKIINTVNAATSEQFSYTESLGEHPIFYTRSASTFSINWDFNYVTWADNFPFPLYFTGFKNCTEKTTLPNSNEVSVNDVLYITPPRNIVIDNSKLLLKTGIRNYDKFSVSYPKETVEIDQGQGEVTGTFIGTVGDTTYFITRYSSDSTIRHRKLTYSGNSILVSYLTFKKLEIEIITTGSPVEMSISIDKLNVNTYNTNVPVYSNILLAKYTGSEFSMDGVGLYKIDNGALRKVEVSDFVIEGNTLTTNGEVVVVIFSPTESQIPGGDILFPYYPIYTPDTLDVFLNFTFGGGVQRKEVVLNDLCVKHILTVGGGEKELVKVLIDAGKYDDITDKILLASNPIVLISNLQDQGDNLYEDLSGLTEENALDFLIRNMTDSYAKFFKYTHINNTYYALLFNTVDDNNKKTYYAFGDIDTTRGSYSNNDLGIYYYMYLGDEFKVLSPGIDIRESLSEDTLQLFDIKSDQGISNYIKHLTGSVESGHVCSIPVGFSSKDYYYRYSEFVNYNIDGVAFTSENVRVAKLWANAYTYGFTASTVTFSAPSGFNYFVPSETFLLYLADIEYFFSTTTNIPENLSLPYSTDISDGFYTYKIRTTINTGGVLIQTPITVSCEVMDPVPNPDKKPLEDYIQSISQIETQDMAHNTFTLEIIFNFKPTSKYLIGKHYIEVTYEIRSEEVAAPPICQVHFFRPLEYFPIASEGYTLEGAETADAPCEFSSEELSNYAYSGLTVSNLIAVTNSDIFFVTPLLSTNTNISVINTPTNGDFAPFTRNFYVFSSYFGKSYIKNNNISVYFRYKWDDYIKDGDVYLNWKWNDISLTNVGSLLENAITYGTCPDESFPYEGNYTLVSYYNNNGMYIFNNSGISLATQSVSIFTNKTVLNNYLYGRIESTDGNLSANIEGNEVIFISNTKDPDPESYSRNLGYLTLYGYRNYFHKEIISGVWIPSIYSYFIIDKNRIFPIEWAIKDPYFLQNGDTERNYNFLSSLLVSRADRTELDCIRNSLYTNKSLTLYKEYCEVLSLDNIDIYIPTIDGQEGTTFGLSFTLSEENTPKFKYLTDEFSAAYCNNEIIDFYPVPNPDTYYKYNARTLNYQKRDKFYWFARKLLG